MSFLSLVFSSLLFFLSKLNFTPIFLPSKHFYQSKITPYFSQYSHSTIEHIVLLKVKDDTDPTEVNSMITGLNGLSTLDTVVHLTAGPIYKNRSTSFSFTHMLHSRHNSKEDLSQYSSHPRHDTVVKEFIIRICDDAMVVDWINSEVNGPLSPKPGSAMRLTFMKLKEGLGDSEKDEILNITKSVEQHFPSIEQTSTGENFSPASTKGFSIASIAFYPDLSELEAANSSIPVIIAEEKEKAGQYLDDVIVVDYVIPSQQSANL